MELTFARGTLTDQFREEVDAFYQSVFGWSATDADVVGQRCHILLPDADQFILLAESGKPMDSPGFDHLGLLQDSRGPRSTTCSRRASAIGRRTTEY